MSFLSVEPQTKVTLKSHSNTILSQFDTHLRIVAERYLAFFQERRSIEAIYIDSLRKLHRKAATVDASFDARSEPSNTRVAWDRLRDNVATEASTQQSFVDILDNDVIKPLKSLKEKNYWTRERIQDDLCISASKYADHAEDKISKLQQAYLKKYNPLDLSQRPEDDRNKGFGGRLFRGRRENLRGPELAIPFKPKEVSDDESSREAVYKLNNFRWRRVENLRDGFDCLENLAFAPTIKGALAKYMDGLITTRAKHDDLAMKVKAEVENVFDGTDTSDLRASFRRALSLSIPPLTLYRNYRTSGYSHLVFGAPLVDQAIGEDNVPKVVRVCIEEVEKRGLDIDNIYSSGFADEPEVLKLRRRFESENTFSFSSAENIHSAAKLLRRYLWDLPEPLLVLSLQEYRGYTRNGARNNLNGLSLLRSKIRELDPVYRETLGALLRHFSRVASLSDKNRMTAKELARRFTYSILRGNEVVQDGIHIKTLVMKDLIQNVYTLFDERPHQSSPVPSSSVADTTSPDTYDSLLSFPSLPSDATMSSRPTPPIVLLSPLLGLPSSKTLTEGAETPIQEQDAPSTAVETFPHSTPLDVEYIPAPTSVAEWRLQQSRITPDPEAGMMPQSPSESVLSSTSDFPLSSATSLQTRMWG